MNISKTTHNVATRRGLALYIDSDSVEITRVEDGEPCDEYIMRYKFARDGGLYYADQCGNDDNDAPAYLANEQSLRNLIKEVPA
tara:strand:+ start:88 stop:339 length:252 start_codon:yes stop_codon:yes gene_type:complete